MKICIVHGSPRKGNTYKATNFFKAQLQKNGPIAFTEFFLPKDLPYFCVGCYACIMKSEQHCPHHQYIEPIIQAMKEADGLIFTSPVYVLAETGAMKAMLDHCAYIFLSHRPIQEMFSKVGMVISTTAGAGTGHVIKNISRNLHFWGVKKIHSCGFTMHAKEWEEMKMTKQQKFQRILRKKADRYYHDLQRREKLPTSLFTKVIFRVMRGMLKGYPEDQTDKVYWANKGWLQGKNKPF
jgi:multimeric flavodoxin WrbA